jgi:hypothetical protein
VSPTSAADWAKYSCYIEVAGYHRIPQDACSTFLGFGMKFCSR